MTAGAVDLATAVDSRVPSGPSPRHESWSLGTTVIVSTTAVLVLLVPDLRHWFVVPVAVCGVLVAPDVVDWARRRLDIFDPQAVLALFGVHFFYLAPLLHVTWDQWPRYLPPAADWREALGQMAVLNLLGLLIYRAVLVRRLRTLRPAPAIDPARLQALGAAVVVISIAAFCWVIVRFGGVGGYLTAHADNREALAGMGSLLLVAGQFPLVAFVMALLRWRDHLRAHPGAAAALVAALAVVQLVAGGLGGSRSHTIWPVLFALCMCHLILAPIRPRVLVAVFALGMAFMYLYGLYKSAGSGVLDVFTGVTSTSELAAQTGRDLPLLVLGDLGRSDIQALVLQRQREGVTSIGYGVSYVGDLAFMVPDRLLPDQPADKVELGTNMLYGPGAYESGFSSSQVYGLAGEAILNFGAVGAVLSFVVLGLFVRFVSDLYRRARSADGTLGAQLVAAVLPGTTVLVLSCDLGNLAWYAANYLAVLWCLVFACRVATQQSAQPAAGRRTPAARPRRPGVPG